MSLPESIITVLQEFQSAFSPSTWNKLQVLIVGTLLARGRRTVTAALRAMGFGEVTNFSAYHHVFNRAVWSPRELSRRLLLLLVRTFVAVGGTITLGVDETLERRWGRRITARGHLRDPLASSKKRSVAASGLHWIVMTLIARLPGLPRAWALPFLSVLGPPPEVSARMGRRHKTIAQWARQMILQVRRWLPKVPLTMVGDRTYSVIELGLVCQHQNVRLIAPLRMDAGLYAPPPARPPGTNGRPRVKGERWPKLSAVLKDPQTAWQRIRVRWYDGTRRELDVISGTGLWYGKKSRCLPIRWVLVRDPKGQLDPKAYFSTQPQDAPREIVITFIQRWTLETTFEESRAHLGFETQRQWSDRAIERITPCLLGLYSLVALLANALHPSGRIPVQTTAWYPKSDPTFSDALATVRRHLWGDFGFATLDRDADIVKVPRREFNRLIQAVCHSH